ncbi:type IV secretion system protein VirB9 [Novosphingobium sp. CF614]|uniref:TrbG/VirB9 family P-type conjugative transfer protein n=1 Tax=Novosphingobium sp. CF614 TaxID=1884364 RepID=UPI0008F40CE9|nr:TrbG/VirB9 family P-type conjugative transfer protein [Novosphingobium sp. CF614]SFF87647.1 type IV secretion system protein VirB9 [Novosphingobium sp. CF614]
MKRRKAPVLAPVLAMAAMLAVTLAAPARADDDRLVEHTYSDKEVVRIEGKAGIQAAIAFGDGESIENVAVGDSQTWQITPNKRADLLFVKPLEAAARTNMTVITNRHTYFFDLVASPKAKPLYMLRFTYKDPKKDTGKAAPRIDAAPGAALAELDPAEQALAAGDPSELPADPTTLNFAWKRTGSARLLPSRVYDDGNATYLLWPEKSAVPAILVQNEKGEEGPINYAVRGTTIVISEVPRKIILRAGRAFAELENARDDAASAKAAMAANTPNLTTIQGN